MKIIFLTNNPNTLGLVTWLKSTAKEDVNVIERDIAVNDMRVFNPDWVISFNYRHLIKEEVLNLRPQRFINLHVGFFPWNRGGHSNLWSFLENTRKGVTIHLIDKGIDTGDILLQKEFFFNEDQHTLASSYEALHQAIQDLFKKNWAEIKSGACVPQKQPSGGSLHYNKDFLAIAHLLGKEEWDVPVQEIKRRYQVYLEQKHENQNRP